MFAMMLKCDKLYSIIQKSGLYEFDQAIDLSKATMAGDVRAHIVRVERSEGGTAILTTNNKQDQKLWLDTLNSAKYVSIRVHMQLISQESTTLIHILLFVSAHLGQGYGDFI